MHCDFLKLFLKLISCLEGPIFSDQFHVNLSEKILFQDGYLQLADIRYTQILKLNG